MTTTHDQFPRDVTGLPEARRAGLVELADGSQFNLTIAPVAKRLGESTVRRLQRVDSRPDPEGPRGLGDHLQHREPW
jgi:hypothetical protein